MEQDAPVRGLSVGMRAVLNLLREHGPMTVPQMGCAQALSRQFGQRTVNDAFGPALDRAAFHFDAAAAGAAGHVVSAVWGNFAALGYRRLIYVNTASRRRVLGRRR